MDSLETLRALGAALAVGLLVGTERGWRDRELAEGGRVAGLRTFALVGLMGGVAAMLSVWAGPWALAVALAGAALAIVLTPVLRPGLPVLAAALVALGAAWLVGRRT